MTIKYDSVVIGINNRLYLLSMSWAEYSDLEAEIETLANAIDFKGFASSV